MLVAERERIRLAAVEARKVAPSRRTKEQESALRRDERAGERERWELRDRLRERSTLKRLRLCGLPGKRKDGAVTLRVSDTDTGRSAGFSGLMACGNVWACPECSRKVAAARADELSRVMGHYLERRGHVAMVTLTLRHNRGQRLALLWDALTKAWGNITRGKHWKPLTQLTGLAGWVRATECTHGCENGWHPHLHVVLMFHERPSDNALDALFDHMWSRWCSKVVAMGLDAPDRDNHGMDVQHIDHGRAAGKWFESVQAMARYVAKGLSLEATMGAQKGAKNGNRTTMELLRDAHTPRRVVLPNGDVATAEDETAQRLWREFEQASHGRRQLEWCRDPDFQAVRKAVSETAEATDEELAEQECGDADDDVAVIPGDQWLTIAGSAWQLKATARQHGRRAAIDWLNDAGIVWYTPAAWREQTREVGRWRTHRSPLDTRSPV